MSNDPELSRVPGVTDKRRTPPGILPRNIPPLLLGGVAVVMVIVIYFSGRSSPKPRNAPAPGAETTIAPPNEAKLRDYPKRIEEEAEKLAKEQAELARTKKALAWTANEQAASPGPGNQAWRQRKRAGLSRRKKKGSTCPRLPLTLS